jgi:hypothetical protein
MNEERKGMKRKKGEVAYHTNKMELTNFEVLGIQREKTWSENTVVQRVDIHCLTSHIKLEYSQEQNWES